ncbi:MAG: peptidase M1, partial [Flavisolibacter sp.]|nr:peptidase M1 [Flavisolibacter sp.]
MKQHYLTTLFLLLWYFTLGQETIVFTDEVIQKEKRQFQNHLLSQRFSVASNNYDVTFYRCSWIVDPAVRYISGSVSSYFTITSATNTITFDLSNALTVDSVLYRGNKINFIPVANDGLQINFPAVLPINTKDSVRIYYQGTPPNNGFGSFNQSNHNGVPVLWTLSEPYGARDWWPCKDVLTDKADSIDIFITYPAIYRSSSNGLPVSETITDDKRTDYWKHRYPIASYLVAFAVTDYVVNQDQVQLPGRMMPVALYAYPESIAGFQQATTIAKAALQKFSELIEEYPFSRERYAQ